MGTTARLTGITRSFKDVVAVRDLDLHLETGRIYGLLGPNGSGKTTTLRTMLGLIDPDVGTVELLGGTPDDLRRARVGFVPEQRALPENSRVVALLTFFARMRGFSRSEARERADEWLGRLDLQGKATARIKSLSNGQQQKVQIALALLCEPDLVLLDEPLAALDPQHQELVIHEVKQAAARGATVVLSTHRLREAQVLLDHVVMLYHGDKVLDRPLDAALEEAFDGTWRVRAKGGLDWLEGPEVLSVTPDERGALVKLAEGASVAGLLERARGAAAELRGIEAVLPDLHDLYMRLALERDGQRANGTA